MHFHVLTLFPEMIHGGLNHSIIKRAVDNELIRINCVNIRDFSNNKHKHVDDYAYGGGAGMVMKPEPIYDAYISVKEQVKPDTKVIFLSPKGSTFTQEKAYELAKEDELILLCGHYEGIDERVIDEIVTEEISIGDFILTGGELGAMIVIDAVSRLIKDVLGKQESYENESFSNNLLEYPHYTRPFEFLGKPVPEVLLSGNHKKIAEWRYEQSLDQTRKKRPDLLNGAKVKEKNDGTIL